MSISKLPVECMVNTFFFLTKADLHVCLQVSKNWNLIANDNEIWGKITICSEIYAERLYNVSKNSLDLVQRKIAQLQNEISLLKGFRDNLILNMNLS